VLIVCLRNGSSYWIVVWIILADALQPSLLLWWILGVTGFSPGGYFAASVAFLLEDTLPPSSRPCGRGFAAMGYAELPSCGYFAIGLPWQIL
jgi:hypothetical protein